MNPRHLTLALRTPLEELLGLPNGIRITLWAREDLARFTEEQLQELLAWSEAMIQQKVMKEQSEPGGGIVERADNRDFDWLMRSFQNHETFSLRDGTPFGFRDVYRVLALAKIGFVIDATGDLSTDILVPPVAAALMEALEAVLLAEVLPDVESVEAIVERAWRDGLCPDPDYRDEVKRAQSQSGRKAAEIRHATNRAVKARALELYWNGEYSGIDAAAKIIGAQVFRSTVTVRNWIFEDRKRRGSG